MSKFSFSMLCASLLSCNASAGIYSGLNLGVNTVTVNKRLFYPLEEMTPTSSSFNNAYTGFRGQIFAGYDYFIKDKFFAQFEANADWITGKSQYTVNRWYFEEGVYAKEQLKYGVSFFLLPAYQYNETTRFFVGPGVSYGYFSVGMRNSAGNVGVSESFSHWLTGGGLKAGVVTALCQNLDLLLTYQFTQYNTIKRTQIEPLSEDTLRGRYKPNANAVFLGLRATPKDWSK